MNKSFLLLILLLVSSVNASVLLSCKENRAELYDIKKQTSDGYKKDSLSINILEENKKFYVENVKRTWKSELIPIGGYQFLEKIPAGHHALYTIHPKENVLTIQKSYNSFGGIMINMYMQCNTK